MSQNFYDVLNVSRDSSADDVKKAYKKAALAHHPDKGGDPEKFKEVATAAETLTDERKRRDYDSALVRARSRDGMRFSGDERSRSMQAPSAPSRSSYERSASANKGPTPGGMPPRPPPQGAVEIPSDPSGLSVKELRELLTALSINHEGCLEKSDLITLLTNRKNAKAGDGAPQSAWAAEKPCTPRQRTSAEGTENQPGQANKATPQTSAKNGPRAIRIKCLSLGSENVGKSCIIKRFCEGRFVQKYITTIGVDYGVKPMQVSGRNAKVNFFDTSGGDEYKDIRVEFYGDTQAVVMVYDVTNLRSFKELDSWIEEADRCKCPISKLQKTGDAPPFVILCANKSDLPRRAVSKDEGMDFASRHGFYYYETSAATGDSVMEAFSYLFEKVVRHHDEVRSKLQM